ncbi:MAG: hypothetical protein R3F33_11595 [Planctomycetota bacterium]
MERAQLRYTATVGVLPSLRLGLEYNPRADDLGVLANWRVWPETETRPALLLGTSSDRIGTPDGRAWFATLSKSLERETGLPIAPYAGIAYGESDGEWVGLAGFSLQWDDRITSTHSWDGHNLHHQIDYSGDEGVRFGWVIAEQDGDYYHGISLGWTP